MPALCVVLGGVVFRWTEIQCSPMFSGNFTPSGHTVKVTSGHKIATIEGFTFVVRRLLLEYCLNVCFVYYNALTQDAPVGICVYRTPSFLKFFQRSGQNLGTPC